jgi:hypothetical protein
VDFFFRDCITLTSCWREPAGGREGVVGSGEACAEDQQSRRSAGRRGDSVIIVELAVLEREPFPNSTREIFEELREASRGGYADYYSITYERLEKEMESTGHALH